MSDFTDRMKTEQAARPAWLVEISTGLASPNDTVRRTSHAQDIGWNSQTFTSDGFGASGMKVDFEDAGALTLRVPDTDGAIKALIETNGAEFQRERVTLYLVDRDPTLLADTTAREKRSYEVSRVRSQAGAVVFECIPLSGILDHPVPWRKLTLDNAPGILREG